MKQGSQMFPRSKRYMFSWFIRTSQVRCPTQVGAFIPKSMLPQPEAATIICRVNGRHGYIDLLKLWKTPFVLKCNTWL